MKIKTLFLVSLVVSALAGCSSSPSEKLAQELSDANEARMAAHKKAQAAAQEAAEDYLELVPQWVITPPKADKGGFYATGIGQSKDLTTSMAKGMLQAEFNLAKSYAQTLSANEKYFKKEEYEKYVQVIDTFINKVDLTGYMIVKRVVKPINGEMNTYVLLKMPFERFSEKMLAEMSKSNDLEAQEAFKELQERIKELPVAESENQNQSPDKLSITLN